MSAGETHRAIEATCRIEQAGLIAEVARMVRDIDRAEELAQGALVIACRNGRGAESRPVPAPG